MRADIRTKMWTSNLALAGVVVPNGYIFNEFDVFQKVNKEIYVYVTPELGKRWKVQAYLRGDVSMCSLEARINYSTHNDDNLTTEELEKRYISNISRMFELGEVWLEKYGLNSSSMKNDMYAPGLNWQGDDITAKAFYEN
ncbi:hypothetical protein [Priestia megaterium]|uniref:Uncharacterized protein n=1 Tax=Priestia megaterium TaxID=1404 RepID=A0A6M6E5P0_PRIMG|nr:hypothetical protein [Priestia megaterium]QJX80449.1 hypothetical protein FDZ14_30645 [Priestia megaterium]